jgi:ABC-type molybdate transport system substrate-binding protein
LFTLEAVVALLALRVLLLALVVLEAVVVVLFLVVELLHQVEQIQVAAAGALEQELQALADQALS